MKVLSLLAVPFLAAVATAQTSVSFADFGRPCGGDLAGSLVRGRTGPNVQLDVTRADAGAVAILVLGTHLARVPHPLPGSPCLLLVEPRATMFGTVDRAGSAQFSLPLPPIAPLVVDFQVVTVELARAGREAKSTDGVELRVR